MKTYRDHPWPLKLISSLLAGLMALPGDALLTALAADRAAVEVARNHPTGPATAPRPWPTPEPPTASPPAASFASGTVGPGLRLLSDRTLGVAPNPNSAPATPASGVPTGSARDTRRAVALASRDPVPGQGPTEPIQILDVDFEVLDSGQSTVTIRYQVDPSRQYVVEYRDQFGIPDFCEPWKQLPGAPHNLGEVTDTDARPSRFYRVRAIESPQAGLFALLSHDTGVRADDGITFDPAITGEVTLGGPGGTLWASLDDPEGIYFPLIEEVAAPQHFQLSSEDVRTLAGGLLRDGPHTLFFSLTGVAEEPVATVQVAFNLDTAPPVITAYLDPATDTLPVGDGQTEQHWVRLLGHTEPGAGAAGRGADHPAWAQPAGGLARGGAKASADLPPGTGATPADAAFL